MAHFDLCVLDADRARHGVNRATVLSLARALAGRAVPVIYQLNKTDLPGA